MLSCSRRRALLEEPQPTGVVALPHPLCRAPDPASSEGNPERQPEAPEEGLSRHHENRPGDRGTVATEARSGQLFRQTLLFDQADEAHPNGRRGLRAQRWPASARRLLREAAAPYTSAVASTSARSTPPFSRPASRVSVPPAPKHPAHPAPQA